MSINETFANLWTVELNRPRICFFFLLVLGSLPVKTVFVSRFVVIFWSKISIQNGLFILMNGWLGVCEKLLFICMFSSHWRLLSVCGAICVWFESKRSIRVLFFLCKSTRLYLFLKCRVAPLWKPFILLSLCIIGGHNIFTRIIIIPFEFIIICQTIFSYHYHHETFHLWKVKLCRFKHKVFVSFCFVEQPKYYVR